ncbi:MAG: hypothetical protein Q8M93_06350 [Polaromonas sp.]|uniref:hypothetical protein n=1 Tax=Polaromonas sp. TaxID=1869339 RepID=UPI00273041F9|nr:hypothetical protein [Polaromonas sp.]MDP2449497.1 hypothetical protein [Polaromonas sp.]MDP3246571.1 hypothetical protein [Polaromonas sp.]MDP3755467.1 hypothetical protein [Polaromonas sp.]
MCTDLSNYDFSIKSSSIHCVTGITSYKKRSDPAPLLMALGAAWLPGEPLVGGAWGRRV